MARTKDPGRSDPLPAWAAALRDARDAIGATGDDIASAMLVGPSTYRNAERGRGGPAVIDALERAFDSTTSAEIRQLWDEYNEGSNDHERFRKTDLLIPLELVQGLAEARVTRFYPSRKHYSVLRDGRGSISEYIETATKSVEMISIALATGIELEGIISQFESMLMRAEPCKITVSLLDPDLDYLARSIAPVVQSSASALRQRTRDAIGALIKLRDERITPARRHLFEIRCHACVPNASAIILDGDTTTGLVQLETKGYQTGMNQSFGFEVGSPSDFFTTLRDSYRRLIDDGRLVA